VSGTLPATPSPTPGTPSPTSTPDGHSPTPTPTLDETACPSDCNRDGTVGVNELIVAVNIALDAELVSQCPSADVDGNGMITVSDLIAAVNSSLNGCPA
jgi:hypothetical protein